MGMHELERTGNAMVGEMLGLEWGRWGRVELSGSRRGAPA